jgi:hypothetical protein
VYSSTSFEKRDDLSSSNLAGVSSSSATPAKIGIAFSQPTDVPNRLDFDESMGHDGALFLRANG